MWHQRESRGGHPRLRDGDALEATRSRQLADLLQRGNDQDIRLAGSEDLIFPDQSAAARRAAAWLQASRNKAQRRKLFFQAAASVVAVILVVLAFNGIA